MRIWDTLFFFMCRLGGISNSLVYQWVDVSLLAHLYYWYLTDLPWNYLQTQLSPSLSVIDAYFCLCQFVRSQGLGLAGCWSALVGFQWVTFFFFFQVLYNRVSHIWHLLTNYIKNAQARFSISLSRLLSPSGVLFSEDLDRFRLADLKVA